MTSVVPTDTTQVPEVASEPFPFLSDAFISTNPYANPGKTHRYVMPVDDPLHAPAYARFAKNREENNDPAFAAISSLERRAKVSAKYAVFRRSADGHIQCEAVFAFGVRNEYMFIAPPSEAGNAKESETLAAQFDLVTAIVALDKEHKIVALLEKSQTKFKKILIEELGGKENPKLPGRDRALIFNTFRSRSLVAVLLDPEAEARILGDTKLQRFSDQTRSGVTKAAPPLWRFIKSLPGKLISLVEVTVIKIGLKNPNK